MRALVVDHSAQGRLRLSDDMPEPEPTDGQVLIAVQAFSLNHGELPRENTPAGKIPGWDAAGIVLQAAADGSGPSEGSRVVARGPGGGWAERRVASVPDVAVVPAEVDLAVAAALPVAGVTALRALRRVGGIVGRRVLITGASGGVGRYAVALAHLGGAQVTAVASPHRAEGLIELGADEVTDSVEAVKGEVDSVLDMVGGDELVAAWGVLGHGGVLVSIGYASGQAAAFPPYATVGQEKTLVSFTTGPSIGLDLEYLLTLVRDGVLPVPIGLRAPWTEAGSAIEAVLSRRVLGKAVLEVS